MADSGKDEMRSDNKAPVQLKTDRYGAKPSQLAA